METLDKRAQYFRDFIQNELGMTLTLDQSLLCQVLLHPSFANEKSLASSYERLEFLGDSIVNAVVTTLLYEKFTTDSEGMLSRLRAALISNPALGQLGKIVGLDRFLFLTGTDLTKTLDQSSKLLGRAFEAFMGAIYLSEGFIASEKMLQKIITLWETQNQQVWMDKERLLAVDVKSKVQELLHGVGLGNPQYQMLNHVKSESKDQFEMALFIDDIQLASAESFSKKEAEKLVAKKILDEWEDIKKLLQNKINIQKDGSNASY